MKITQIHTNKPQSLSFEIFPPKKEEDFKNIDEMLEILCDCHPEYISVTFGAGGSSNNNKTIEIAKKIKNQYNVEPVVHLTCLCYNKAEIDEFTRQLSYEGIENILALRGDRNPNVPAKEDFLHASDLIKYIKETTGDQFCIAGACYPDIHPEAADKVDDIKNLKKKVDAGAELLLSQLFFDNDTFFNFAEDCRLAGINVPVIPGIMPCINAAQIQRMVTMCGAKFPEKFQKIVHRYGDNKAALFDAGMSLKSSNFQEGKYKANAKNSSFDYIGMQFRLHPRLGMTIGYTPFSTVGYNFTRSKEIENSSDVTISNNFYGDGGLQQIFGGVGFKILDNLSIGANIGYLYGKLNYQTTASLSNGGDQTITYNTVSISSYNASFGLQYTQPINKQNELTLGLTYSLGHTLNGHDTQGTQITNGTNYSVVNQQQIDDSYGIPHIYGGGLAWKHKKNLTVEVDYTLQKWSGVKYNNRTDLYQNRSKVAIGAEFLPKEFGRSYFSRIRYRAGAYYANSNLQIPVSQNMIDGPKEYGVSVGLGLPLKLYQRNSVLSITGQYIHANPSVSDMLSENRFVLKIGLTFNEHWFMKWRVN